MDSENTTHGVVVNPYEPFVDSVEVSETGEILVNFEKYTLGFPNFDHFERFFYLTKEAYEALRSYNRTEG